MLLTRYTSTEAIRAVLGVNEVELEDSSMAAQNLDIQILLELDSRAPGHGDKADLAVGAAPTAGQVADLQRLRLAAQYLGAWVIARNPILFMQEIGDGKNKSKRFGTVDWNELARSLLEEAQRHLDQLSDSTGTAAGPVLIGIASPTRDPVTNT